jgi:hypothetical protein
MKYVIKIMGSPEFYTISEGEFKMLDGRSGLMYFPSLGGVINLNSVACILPEHVIGKDRIKLHDGGWAVKKFGAWVSEGNPDVRLDLSHYKYLAKDQTPEEYEDEQKKITGAVS